MGTTTINKIFKYTAGLLWNPFTESQTQGDSIETAMRAMPTYVTNAADRDARFGVTPVAGSCCYRADLQWEERWYDVGSASNPLGPAVAGWYPVGGLMPVVAALGNAAAQTATSSAAGLLFTKTTVQRNITYSLATGMATITQAGLYHVSGSARWTTVSSDCRLYISLNGNVVVISPASAAFGNVISETMALAVGDVVGVQAYSSPSQVVVTTQRAMSVQYLGPA